MTLLERLQSSTFSLQPRIVEATTSRIILDRIKDRAIAKWGDKWVANLAREYASIAKERGDEKATTVNRRPQLERAFESGSCTLETAIVLAAATGCKFQMACLEVEEF